VLEVLRASDGELFQVDFGGGECLGGVVRL